MACSTNDSAENEAQITSSIKQKEIKSQKAYDKGYAEGRRIVMMKDGYERENAIIEMHSLISSLERNGFPQTASDFSEGFKAAFSEQ